MALISSEPASSRPAKLGPQTLLSIRNVAKSFGRTPVLRDISLQVAEGEFLTVLGESGSGKTTLLALRLPILARFGWKARDSTLCLLTVAGSTPYFNITRSSRT